MANARTPTLLSLAQYADIIGMDPRYFHQVTCTAFPADGGCDPVWMQEPWMDPDKASREDLARAIAQAESRIAQLVGFWPAPQWIANESSLYPTRQVRVAAGYYAASPLEIINWRRKSVETRWARVQKFGRRHVADIELNATILYSTPDGDAFNEWATISITTDTAGFSENEIAVFAGDDTSPEKRIRNLKVTLTPTSITIEGDSVLFIDPQLWLASEVIDGDVPGNFLVTANVHRVYTRDDTTAYAAVTLDWIRHAYEADYTTEGFLRSFLDNRGVVIPVPAQWNTTTETWTPLLVNALHEPHRAHLWYKAGWTANVQGLMEEPFARAVAALATTLLSDPICGCGSAERLIDYWQSLPTGREVTFEMMECPFGPKRGAWEAYKTLVGDFVTLESASV